MDPIPAKPVSEDWRHFNDAVFARADYLKGLVVPPLAPPPPPSPRPTADWLRRGLGVGVVVFAAGVAAALILWALAPPAPVSVAAVPPAISAIPPPVMPEAKVVVDYTRFTTVSFQDFAVYTGWKFSSSEDTKPSTQYCYARLPGSGVTFLNVVFADSTVGILPYDEPGMAPLTHAQYDKAVSACSWFPGTILPPNPAAHSERPKGKPTSGAKGELRPQTI